MNALLLAAALLAVPDPVPLSLDDAIVRALAASHAVGRSRADVGVADAGVRLALAERLPRFSLGGQAVWNIPEVEIPFSEEIVVRLLPEADWQAQVRVTQPLYTGGRLNAGRDQAKTEAERARDTLRATEDATVLRVVSAYLEVARGVALIQVEEQSVELARRRLRHAEAFYEAGEVTKVDVLRASAAIKGAERRLAGARQLRETAVGLLRLELVTDGDFQVRWPEDLLPPLDDEETLVENAAQHRPEVAAARRTVELARLEVESRKGERRPALQAEGTLTQQRGNFPAERFGAVALGFSVPIYQGGRLAARRAVAELRHEQARLGLAEAEIQVREGVRRLLVDLRTAKTTLGLAREQLAAVEAEHEQVSDLYEALEATSLDAAAAELALAEARRAVVNSKLDRDLAEVRVYYATGELRAALLHNTSKDQQQ